MRKPINKPAALELVPEPTPAPVVAPMPVPEPAPPTLMDRLLKQHTEAELEDLAAGKVRLLRMSF